MQGQHARPTSWDVPRHQDLEWGWCRRQLPCPGLSLQCDGANVKVDKGSREPGQGKGRACRSEGRYANFWEEGMSVRIAHSTLVPPSSRNVLFLSSLQSIFANDIAWERAHQGCRHALLRSLLDWLILMGSHPSLAPENLLNPRGRR